MRRANQDLHLSATDLAAFFECGHKTLLDLRVANKELQAPGQSEVERRMLERRGREHEARALAYYQAQGYEPFDVGAGPATSATAPQLEQLTREAMRRGERLIYQGVLRDEPWLGRPDFLLRVDTPSALGDYSYEPVDAKLSRSEKARAILQLCVYADLLEQAQGVVPESLWLILGTTSVMPTQLRAAKYLAYYRKARQRLRDFVADDARAEPYPEPCEHCDVCGWWKQCETRRRKDDHLSLVAGITRRQRGRLELVGVRTLEELAQLPPERPVDGIDTGPLTRIREQARMQRAGRVQSKALYELITDADAGSGLELLPEPRPGDLFLDLEGDAFALDGGLEYLFGLLELGQPEFDFVERDAPGPPNYLAFWATNAEEEKRAFGQLMNRIEKGLGEFPDLHIYHFGVRESAALKRLSCRYGIYEDTVDHLLRNGLLVDLHAVVKQGLRASVEAYTLKELEPLHGFERSVDKRAAARAMQYFGWWLETHDAEIDAVALRTTLAQYNQEDCRSTWQLRDWLEARRAELAQRLGRELVRPTSEPAKASEASERAKRITALHKRLLETLPADGDPSEIAAQRLLADLVGWHWREQKSSFWEYFTAKDVPPAEWLESHLVLGGLSYQGQVGEV